MEYAVIILNYNSKFNTLKCIESFNKNKNDNITFKFIVIDNYSSEEGLDELLKNKSFRFLKNISNLKNIDKNINENICVFLEKNHGYSYGNNVGLKIAKTIGFKYAIVANPDTEMINLNNLNSLVLKKKFVAIFPKVLDSNDRIQSIYISTNAFGGILANIFYPIYYIGYKIKRNFILNLSKKHDLIKIDFSIGCFIIFDLEEFEKIKYFDENVFLYNEEKILMERCKQIRIPLYYSDKLIVRHNHVYKEISDFSKHEGIKSKKYYYKKYKNYSDFLIKLIFDSEKVKNICYDPIINLLKKIRK